MKWLRLIAYHAIGVGVGLFAGQCLIWWGEHLYSKTFQRRT